MSEQEKLSPDQALKVLAHECKEAAELGYESFTLPVRHLKALVACAQAVWNYENVFEGRVSDQSLDEEFLRAAKMLEEL